MDEFQPKLNFASSTVATAPSPATSGTSLTLHTGDGALFPDPAVLGAYNLVVSAIGAEPTISNAEIIAVTARTGDVLTIVRQQEGTSARTVIVGDKIVLTPTAGVFKEIAGGKANMTGQAIVNGGFSVAQRGTSLVVTPNTGQYLTDCWHEYHTPDAGTLPTITVSQQALTPGDLPYLAYFHRVNVNGAGTGLGANSDGNIGQRIENGTRLLCGLGRSVTVSFYARSSIANKNIGVFMRQNYGSGGSPTALEVINGSYTLLTSNWVRYSFTIQTNTLVGKTFGTDGLDYIDIVFQLMWGSTTKTRIGAPSAETYVGAGNIDITGVRINSGDSALPFQPISFDRELRRCERYYEKSFEYGVAPVQNVGSYLGALLEGIPVGGASAIWSTIKFRTPKCKAPTVTTYNPSAANANWRDTNAGSDVTATLAGYASTSGEGIRASVGVGNTNDLLAIHWTAEANL